MLVLYILTMNFLPLRNVWTRNRLHLLYVTCLLLKLVFQILKFYWQKCLTTSDIFSKTPIKQITFSNIQWDYAFSVFAVILSYGIRFFLLRYVIPLRFHTHKTNKFFWWHQVSKVKLFEWIEIYSKTRAFQYVTCY